MSERSAKIVLTVFLKDKETLDDAVYCLLYEIQKFKPAHIEIQAFYI